MTAVGVGLEGGGTEKNGKRTNRHGQQCGDCWGDAFPFTQKHIRNVFSMYEAHKYKFATLYLLYHSLILLLESENHNSLLL